MNNANLQAYTNEFAAVPGMQECCNPRACKMKVEGKGEIKVRPDIALVNMSVVTENRELSKAQSENAIRMSAVQKSLHENGIPSEDIQTQSYNIIPQYDFIEGKQVFRGYRVEHSLEVTVREVGRVGKVIDDAVQNGANQVNSITFSLSNPTAYYQLALKAAIDDALIKARTIGNKLNIAVANVPIQIVELGLETGGPVPLTQKTFATATPIQSGLLIISSRIEAVFAYKPMY
jgi:Uncharacterized conserved protein